MARNNNLKLLNNYDKACFELFKAFVHQFEDYKHYNDKDILDMFVGDNLSMINIADMYLLIDDICNYFNLGCSLDDFIDWYWWDLDNKIADKKTMNLKNWLIDNKKLTI